MIVKIVVTVAAALLLAFGLRFYLRWRHNGLALDNTEPGVQAGSTQDECPLKDIADDVLIRIDGVAVSVLKVECKMRSLKTNKEQIRDIEDSAAAISQMDRTFSILHISRPIDTTGYLTVIDAAAADTAVALRRLASYPDGDPRLKNRDMLLQRRALLAAYREEGEREQRVGTRTRGECYIAIPVSDSRSNADIARDVAQSLKDRLSEVGYTAHLLSGNELIELLMGYNGHFPNAAEVKDPNHIIPWTAGIQNTTRTVA
jgi:hypothetical protein